MSDSIYQQMIKTGVPISNHSSDLYVKVTPATKAIIETYELKQSVSIFRSLLDKEEWYDIPFAFDPWWESKMKGET